MIALARFNAEDVENITVIFSVDFYQPVTNFRNCFFLSPKNGVI